MTMSFTIPTLKTERLILRAPRRGDFDAFANMLASDRTRFMGGPYDRMAAWHMFSMIAGNWTLDGFGGWIITDAKAGVFLGDMTIWQPDDFPEPEIGWTLTPKAEGQGFAAEAAGAALAWYWESTPAESVVSYIHLENARSIALAKKLGATQDAGAAMAEGDTADDTAVYRHRRAV